MRQMYGNTTDGLKMFLARMTAEKRKCIVALCLITLMGIMWARLLSSNSPSTANAIPMSAQPTEAQLDADLRMFFIELPKVKGRNDVLTRDFFVADKRGFGLHTKNNVVSVDGTEGIAKHIARKLKLEVIGFGENRQAFINDKLFSVGDILVVSDNTNTYECKLVAIKQNTVYIQYRNTHITLKLAQAIETGD